MKPDQDIKEVQEPADARVVNDDAYLVEMTDRLQRLRSLVAAQEQRSAPSLLN